MLKRSSVVLMKVQFKKKNPPYIKGGPVDYLPFEKVNNTRKVNNTWKVNNTIFGLY